MNGRIAGFNRVAVGLLVALSLSLLMSGQGVRGQDAVGRVTPAHVKGVPHDWSQQHIAYSDPGTEAEAFQQARRDEWVRTVNDPRYTFQQLIRNPELRAAAIGSAMENAPAFQPDSEESSDNSFGFGRPDPPMKRKLGLTKDWSTTLGAGLVNPNTFPAKFSFITTSANCGSAATPDFVVYPTGTAGSGTQATIVAYDNLYTTGCTGTVPSVYWQYNTAYPQGSMTGDGSKVTTSPILSYNDNGAQVAFVQVTTTTASLVVLKWTSSATLVQLDTATNNVVPASYRACATPCMTRITFNGSPNNTWSQPFYDYAHDLLYVGDNAGKLHEFSGVFNGTPQEITTGWPAALSTVGLAAPIYDAVSGCVFVGDENGVLYSVNSGVTGTVCTGTPGTTKGTSETLGNGGTGTEGIFDAPLVDSNAGTVYVFVTDSKAIGNCGANTNCIYQYKTSLTTTGAVPNGEQPLGTGAANDYIFSGDFDNIYLSSSNGTAGNIYALGNTGAATGANLYRIPVSATSTITTTPVVADTVSSTSRFGWGSPVTEFCNNGLSACTASGTATTAGTDYVFVSVFRGTEGGCSNSGGNGCVVAYNVSTPSTRTEPGALSSFSTSTTFTSPHLDFTAADIGKAVSDSGGDFAAGTTITGYTSGGTNDTITISNSYFCFTGCGSDTITVGGVLAVAANQNLTTYASPGCWVTGGFIVDNSVPTGTLVGASQIYYISLFSSTTPLAICGVAGSGTSMSAVQTSQSAP